jgi:uncharacterized phage-associated protein
MLNNLFNERKAAQAAAYFLFRAGGRLDVLKLMKLLYLAERRSFEKYGEPMIGDRLVSMPHGPVLSRTYNYMNGELPSAEGGWDSWIADRAEHVLSLKNPKSLRSPESLKQLSDADLGVLDEVWKKFGRMTGSQLRNYTHRHCPEWKDPEGSMIPMQLEDLFKALNFTPARSREALARLREASEAEAAFARARE